MKSILSIAIAGVLPSVLLMNTYGDDVYQGNGIKIGEVTQTNAIIWTRLTSTPELNDSDNKWKGANKQTKLSEIPAGATLADMNGAMPGTSGSVRLAYWPKDSQQNKTQTDWVPVDGSRDHTHQYYLDALEPGLIYRVSVESRDENGRIGQTVQGSFRTAPAVDQSEPVTFTVVTGQEYWRRDDAKNGHKIYDIMRNLNPDFFVHTGDILYYDKPKPLAKNVEFARYKWNRQFGLPFQRSFHKGTASYFIKDDHDTLKNDCWPGQRYGDLSWEQGLSIFREQVPSRGKTYRTVRWGKDLQVWLVEGRDFRSPNNMPDGPEKTIWGEEQKQWFFQSVLASDATFKILISPTPLVGPDRTGKGDNHANLRFAHEGQELRQFISQQSNMFVCCGDRHWQYVSVDTKTGVREFSCGPTTNKHAGGWSNDKRSPMHQYLNVVGGFLAVTVESSGAGKAVAVFRHYGTDGTILNEDRQVAR